MKAPSMVAACLVRGRVVVFSHCAMRCLFGQPTLAGTGCCLDTSRCLPARIVCMTPLQLHRPSVLQGPPSLGRQGDMDTVLVPNKQAPRYTKPFP
ncbi:hypothetical protein PoB_004460600 [Plakobranchus ocellatus]|uniref:Secreted protein n=1 Tax=Plakobranchus ocellatus TaxID=259542 RepID=A0AAV4B426_9GAST|nr:hypothetical protein PoB_004460600 [Plakobranchus ocellatus]